MHIKLDQIRLLAVLEAENSHLSRSAERLGLSQPAASRLLAGIEEAMGGALFVRHGKRLAEPTPLGRQVLAEARRIVAAESNLRLLAADRLDARSGILRIATTHAQARYFLPGVLRRFAARWPNVRVSLRQSMPAEIVESIRNGNADIAICTETIDTTPFLNALPCYRWTHALCAPAGHPVFSGRMTGTRLAALPVLTYLPGITGRERLEAELAAAGIRLDVRLEAADSDVLKSFIRTGSGIGLIATMAYDRILDADLRLRRLEPVCPVFQTRAAWHEGRLLRQFERSFLDFLGEEGPLIEERIARVMAAMT